MDKLRQQCAVLEEERNLLRTQLSDANAELRRRDQDFSSAALTHAEELSGAQTRGQTRMEHAHALHTKELLGRDEQHREVVENLKRIHLEELDSVRERGANAKSLEDLAHKVSTSAGLLKLLEQQVRSGSLASESSREAQLEARERLINDMEESARRNQQRAEEECLRLQGLLASTATAVSALRSGNAEERERMRAEHERLLDFQVRHTTTLAPNRNNNIKSKQKQKQPNSHIIIIDIQTYTYIDWDHG
jgi:hypothetical protein